MVESWHEETAHASYCFEAADLPTKNVVVYSDRAEVKRVVKVSLSKGTSEIILKNVSAVIERQSVRVDGHGVLIQEVQYQEMPIDTEQENEKIRALEREKVNMENERFAIEDEMCSLRKRIEVLDGVASQIATGPPSTSSLPNEPLPLSTRRHTVIGSTASQFSHSAPSVGFLVNEETISNLAKFLSYYSETVSNMKTSLRSRQRDLDQQSEKIEALERKIDQLRCGYEYDSVRRNITIVVEMEAPAAVELFVSYQVYCASWKPAYDIRAVTTAGGEQENKIKLCYYGLVEQNTGDDWNDTDMVLSTASPSVGGCAPQLATLSASIQRPSKNQRQRQPSARRKPLYEASEEDMGFGSYDCNEMADAAALHRFTTAQISRSSEDNSVSTPSVENLVSTCFSVPRAVNIPSNGAEHKVLIMMVDLACSYTHDCVPPRCASAFLSAVITNTTPFPLPPGDAAVYLNNGFVTKTHLRAVPPGEEFRCSLGTDPSIKIDYKTPTISQEQVGFMSKSTLITHEQMISLRNAKATQAVQLTVKEQIPKSTDEKIKVCIVSPDVRAKHGEAKLNKDHNLEWTFVLAPGQQRDLLVKYTIEHPASEAVSFKQLA
ncbi:unnamed protein product [Cylicocyclus nassatus]|uniref:DUF4139 domain-containing protein n=1 Tax=Cylicocyclus nassatus TaxID=53992 RepID=A0AA36H2N2_CYLNA|nr:unnamed protein product [Cylicocyclus nassatus]